MIRFLLRNHLSSNLGLVFIILIGLSSWFALPREVFPVIRLDLGLISTQFDGATPEEIEEQIVIPIEEAFENVQDIDYISSTSDEGLSRIYINLKPDSNMDEFMQEARTLLDGIDDLPEAAEEPQLSRARANFPVITLTLYGNLSQTKLHRLADQVRRELLKLEGVANVGIAGNLEWELWVIVDPHRLAALQVPLQQISNTLRNNLRDRPGGTIKAVEGDIRLRGRGATPEPAVLKKLVLRSSEDGGQLLLGEVAQVQRRFEEADTHARLNGKPSINLTITKTEDASTIKVAQRARDYAAQLEPHLPAGIEIALHTDLSKYVKIRLNTVQSSGLVGLTLLLISLYLMLNLRVALIAAIGIPVSFLFAAIVLYYLGFTLNMVSLFAFLIVLGMIVDDAIIVTENIYRHMENGVPPKEASYRGAREVAGPVVVATMTTVAAFLPMMAIGGTMGLFIKVIPVVVAGCLIGSLLESFAVLPSHTAMLLRVRRPAPGTNRWQKLLEYYTVVLRSAMDRRYLTLAITVGVLVVSTAYAASYLPYKMFGKLEIGQFFLNIEAPNTYSLEESQELAETVEQILLDSFQEHELDTMLTNVGISFIDFNRFRRGSNLLQIVVDLQPAEPKGFIERWISPLISFNFSSPGKRKRSADEIIDQVRQRLAGVPGIQRMSILLPEAGPAGDDIELGIVARDPALLKSKADEILNFMQSMEGMRDARHDQEEGKLEFQYLLNEKGRRLGLTQAQLTEAVSSGFLGIEVVHVTWEDQRLPVRMIYPEELRRRSTSINQLPIVLASGETVFLADVAEIQVGRGLNQIRRRNGQRMAKLTASVDSDLLTPLQASARIQQQFEPGPKDGYELLFLGERKETRESFKGMKQALLISLCLIFFMLATLFRSLSDPLAVLLTIPFGLIGVIWGHALFGHHLQFISMVGMLALTGIIVNDSLILVDFARRRRNAGASCHEAMLQAGKTRMRPILLTTITTFLGVSPLIFFPTGQTAFLSPMAISLGFGLLFATLLILITLPCLYLIIEDIKSQLARLLRIQPAVPGDTQVTN